MGDANRGYFIYCHISPSGKKYIGQTNDPYRRWRAEGYRRCPKLFAAIKKYGWDHFRHEIYLCGLTKEEADFREKEFIEKMDTIEKGYNISPGGTGGNQKGIRPVDLYTKDGSFVRSFKTANEAAIFIGCHRTFVSGVLNGKIASVKGYRVVDKGQKLEIRPNYKSINNHNNRKFKVFDTMKNEHKYFESLKACADYYGFNYNSFRNQVNTCKHNRYKFLLFEVD